MATDEEYSLSEQFLDSARGNDVDAPLDVNHKDPSSGANALHMACANGNLEALRFLLAECEPTCAYTGNSTGSTPLHWAIQNRQWKVVPLLLNDVKKLNVLEKNDFGLSPLDEIQNYMDMTFTPDAQDTAEAEVVRDLTCQFLAHPSAAALDNDDNNNNDTGLQDGPRTS